MFEIEEERKNEMRGYYTNAGFFGLVNGVYILFASESDYYDSVSDD
ncbi:MAG: hypothetical protein IJH53_07355 [Oscillospiraceae bacterium]|nr:hypothetical protein [Oscillospiraceae bacterium]